MATGTRKVGVSRETLVSLLLGMMFCAWMKADVQLYFAFGAFVVGRDFSFMWANTKEHAANKTAA